MKYKLKLFDSLAHPTLTGRWDTLSSNKIDVKCSFEDLNKSMKKNNVYKALAIGMNSFEDYDHLKFIKECKKYNHLIPVAGINPNQNLNILIKEVNLIKKLGFTAVKIHPRISNLDLRSQNFRHLLKILEKKNLVTMICTFPQIKLGKTITPYFFDSLISAIDKTKYLKIILVHGGCAELLKYSDFVKTNDKRILLDLSLTVMRYAKSSIDLDLKYIFKNLDKLICIGSDYPEIDYLNLKKRLNYLTKGLSKHKLENILYKNLESFIG